MCLVTNFNLALGFHYAIRVYLESNYSSHLAPADARLGAAFSIVKMHQAFVALKGKVYGREHFDKYWQYSIDIFIDYYWHREIF
jgi:hypothetical protein